MKEVYLDYAATTPVDKQVFKEMEFYLKDEYGNPSSIYLKGQRAKNAVENSREKIAKIINADSSEIVFTSCATESSNLALKGVGFFRQLEKAGNHIITTKIEHPSVLNTIKYLVKVHGFKATYIDVDKYGLVNVDDLKRAITDKTILVSVMFANNEIGTIEPIKEIGDMLRDVNKIREAKNLKPIYFHVDAVQAVSYLDIDVKDLNIDLMSITGHKFYAPKGVGALYIKKGVELLPQQSGGGQEKHRRAGTENVAGIVAMAKALEIVKEETKKEVERLSHLRDSIFNAFSEIEDSQITGSKTKRLPHIASFVFKYVEGESLLLKLNNKGIFASTASACSSDSLSPSHVLLAIGIKHEVAHGSLRISLGKYTKKEDVDYLIKTLPPIISDLREMSAVKGDF
ncbi:cysteine desulfurase [bacterium]|nr:cysteine desulfurase [bacterium]